MNTQTGSLPVAPTPPTVSIEHLILSIRGERVMLASDLAAIYGVQTRALNQAVKRNADRFPIDFAFRLSPEEFAALRSDRLVSSDGRAALRSQSVILKRGQHAKYPPYAFTEHGAIMAANVLNSRPAVAMSVYVVRAFVKQRETVAANQAILKRLAEIDGTLLQHDTALRDIYRKLRPLFEPAPEPPRRQIGFHANPEA
ncbi:MAG: ORF6N domain-containing protein [Limisphaerales bacterium]